MKTWAVSAIAMVAVGAVSAQAQTLDQVRALAPAQALPMPAAETPGLTPLLDVDYPGVIDLKVDASDIDRHVIAIHETIPVAKAGPNTLLIPKWLPGAHGPDADFTKIAGLHILVDGREVPWRRDNVAMQAFHFDVPEGAKTITANFQYLAPVQAGDGVIVHTRNMLDLQWENESLYPDGYFTRRIAVKVTLTLPKDWGYGSALETEKRDGDVVTFKPISYDNLIDSPLIAGRYFKRYDLDPGAKVPVYMNVVADDAKHLDIPDKVLTIQRNVVQEAYKLFGSKHYDHYDFLVAVSDQMGGIGLEHHRSSEDAVVPEYFKEVAGKGFGRNILPHEYVHSWDGKFRRPAGQFTGDFARPMRDELLWVYEGGTQYWGELIESRSGLYTFDQRLQMLAVKAMTYDILPGRQWRDLQDTAYDPIISNRGPKSWPSWQRNEDYYDEGALIWLEADTLIRDKTKGKKSLDDFAKGFFGMHDGSYLPDTYEFADVVKAMNDVYAYDWTAFFTERLTRKGGGAPLDSLARAGYRLVTGDTQSEFLKSDETRRKSANLMFGPGLRVAQDGTIVQVMWGSAAFTAGLSAGTKIVAVNGHVFSGDRLKDAVIAAHTAGDTTKIDLLVLSGEEYRTVGLDYHEGLRYPHLERIAGTKDLLRPIYGAPDK